MNRMRKCNDEVYQLAKDQALVKKLKNKKFRPFCLCLPGVMFVTRGSKNSLFSVFISPLPEGGGGYTVLPLSVCPSIRPRYFSSHFSQ